MKYNKITKQEMKKKLLKVVLPVIFVVTMLTFVACSKIGNNNSKNDGKGSSDEENRVNPLGISSMYYEKCEKDQYLDEAENVKYLASIANQNGFGNFKGCYDITVHNYTDSNILIDYIYGNDKNFTEGIGIERHFKVFNKDTGKLVNELIVKEDDNYVLVKENCISVENVENGVFTATTYDFDLNEIANFSIDEVSAIVSSDGKRVYYASNHRLVMYDSQTGESKTVDSKNEFSVYTVMDVATDESGHDYVKISAMAADYNWYNFIYDMYNDEIDYVTDTDTFLELYDGFAVSDQYSEDYAHISWIVGISERKAYYYNITDEIKANTEAVGNIQMYVLSNGDLLFTYSEGDKVYADVYDKEESKRKASTAIDIANIRRESSNKPQDMEYYTDIIWITRKSYYISDDVMMLVLSDINGTEYYLQWQMDDAVDNNMIKVSNHKIGAMSVDISKFDNELLIPGELSDEFKPLREFADRLEKEYDIEINIGEECSDVCEIYLVYPMLDYGYTERALYKLEAALEKYPKNFFSQFKYEGVEGIDIHFSEKILGISDESLGSAGGLKCVENGRLKLVLDIDDEGAFDITFHHELCHAIDEVIAYKQSLVDDPVYSSEKWNMLNPYDDMYTYNYVDWGKSEYWQYSYDNEISDPGYNGGTINAYFIDAYSMTYPTEDRARLFENIMREQGRYVDFENSPNLLAKVNYFAMCIRASFDTTGWEDVPWEAYLE